MSNPFNNPLPFPSYLRPTRAVSQVNQAAESFAVDRQRFDEKLLEQLPKLWRLAVRLTGSPESADELTQETLLRATQRFVDFRGQAKLGTWLIAIAINAFRDQLRRAKKTESASIDNQEDRDASPPAGAMGNELAERIAQLVSQLPPRQREVLVLITYERLNATETAELLQISEQNVRTTLSLARQKLKDCLPEYFGSSP